MTTEIEPGQVIWLTGLSGAGKTTLAERLCQHLRQKSAAVVLLDGDVMRAMFSQDQPDGRHHDRAARLALALKYSQLCKMLSEQGLTVVIATMSLFHIVHQWNRQHLQNYLEIYLKVPMAELQRRDPKGLYKKFAHGETKQIAGLDLAFEEPEAPDVLLEYHDGLTIDNCLQQIIQTLASRQIQKEDA